MISRIYQSLRVPLATLAIVLTLVAVGTAPAAAHSTIVEQGNDFAVTDSNHQSGAVCDMEADGHFVSATWYDDEGFRVGYEEDGGDAGCDQISFHGTADTVYVCEVTVGDFWCTDSHKV